MIAHWISYAPWVVFQMRLSAGHQKAFQQIFNKYNEQKKLGKISYLKELLVKRKSRREDENI